MAREYAYKGPTPFDGPYSRRRIFRPVRNAVLMIVAMCLFFAVVGLPYLRVTYRCQGTAENVIAAEYWGPTGRMHVRAGQFEVGCPPVLFIRLTELESDDY